MQGYQIVLLVVCIALSALFSGTEAAFLSLQRVRLMHLVKSGAHRADRVARFKDSPDRFLSIVLLGNNLVNTAAAALGTALAISLLRESGTAVLVSTIGVTLLLLIFGETTPKTLATRHSERIAFTVVRLIEAVDILLLPFTRALEWFSKTLARFSGGDTMARVTEEEIRTLIHAGKEEGAVESAEAEMLEKVFHFGDRVVREVMTPRIELIAVQRGTTLQDFLEMYSQHSHTRFPVYEESVDNIIGTLSVKDVVRALAQGKLKPSDSVTRLLRPAHFVPENKPVAELFFEMRSHGHPTAVVADEYGGVAGLVTIKQLLEVVVGPVGEEGEPLEEDYRLLSDNVYRMDADISIEEANEKMEIGLPEGEYQTVAGFILERLGHIPQEGEMFTYRDLEIKVRRMNGVRIETVDVQRTIAAEDV